MIPLPCTGDDGLPVCVAFYHMDHYCSLLYCCTHSSQSVRPPPLGGIVLEYSNADINKSSFIKSQRDDVLDRRTIP